MKKIKGRKNLPSRGSRRNPKSSRSEDPFFNDNPKRRRKIEEGDFIDSDEEYDDEIEVFGAKDDDEEEEEAQLETADEKRLRIANAYLEKIRAITARRAEEEEEEGEEEGEEEREGKRDSLVAKILQQEQLEESGRAQRFLASG